MRRARRATDQPVVPWRGCRGIPYHGEPLANGSGGELYSIPARRRSTPISAERLVKSPKLYFYDVGLASHLIGIEHAGQIGTHPLRGPLFENAIVVEALKHRFNRARRSNLSFFRDSRGLECDLLCENGHGMAALEIKSGATVASDWFDSLNLVAKELPEIAIKAIVYGGEERQFRRDAEVVPLADLSEMLERMDNRKEP